MIETKATLILFSIACFMSVTECKTTALPTTPAPSCLTPFDLVGGKCILVDPYESSSWTEARYLCERLESDLVVLDDFSFYISLIDYLKMKGLEDNDYWVGANDTDSEGQWTWVNQTPVRMGTPLWAIYGTSSYEQEPRTSTSDDEDCGFLSKNRFLYMDDSQCELAKGAICEKPLQ